MKQYCKNNITLFLAILLILLAAGCATLPTEFSRPISYAYTYTDGTPLGQSRREEIQTHSGQSGFLLLGNGLDAFVARAVLSHVAERSIDAQYYLLHKDLVGALFIDQLLKAADRGVRVRLLVDDMDLADRDLGAAVLDSHPNMEVRIFNPFSRKTGRMIQFITRLGSVTRRMHNKSFTVDNQATILGGRNIGDAYFEADPDMAFADLDVLVIGPAVKDVSTSFDDYWNSELAYPATVLQGSPPTVEEIEQARKRLDRFVAAQIDSAYLKALRDSDLSQTLKSGRVQYQWGEAVVVYDVPEKIMHDADKREYHLAPSLRPYFEGVQQELIIFSPYFVPGKKGTAFLIGLAQRGVRVRILTNSLASTDVGIVHAGYAKYRKDLLRGGVELYELNKTLTRKQRRVLKSTHRASETSLHAKSFIFDRNKIFIGSLNLDPRAIVHNTEIGVVLTSPEIANTMGKSFDGNIERVAFRLELNRQENGYDRILWHGIENGKQQVFKADPYTGFWRRFGLGFIGMFPIESQL